MTVLTFAINFTSAIGVLVEAACVSLFIARHQIRKYPLIFLFFAYLCGSDLLLVILQQKHDVWPALVATTYIGYVCEAAAVWELAYIVIRRTHPAVRRRTVWVNILGFVFCGIATYLMTNMRSFGAFGSSERTFLHVDLTVSIYRVLALSIVVGMGRGSPFREDRLLARIASIFAVYAACALLKHAFDELFPSWQLPPTAFSVADCICSLVWVVLLSTLCWHLVRLGVRKPLSVQMCEH